MKRIVFHIALAFVATHAAAQSTYSFSGLNWGDSSKIVSSKLKAAGYSGCPMYRQLLCKTVDFCNCDIEGPAITMGRVEFNDDKLEEVFVQVHDAWVTADVLEKKYGPAMTRPRPEGLSKFDLDLDKRWKAPTGETLFLNHDARFLTYTSAAKNRSAILRNRSNNSAF